MHVDTYAYIVYTFCMYAYNICNATLFQAWLDVNCGSNALGRSSVFMDVRLKREFDRFYCDI